MIWNNFFIDLFDIAQEFVTPHTVLGRCDEVGRKLLPLFTQLLQVVADVAVYPAAFQFVGFGENDGEGYSVLAQPFYESEVYGLRLVTAVDEDKEAGHLLALQNVGLYDALNLFLAFLSALGIAVARKVDDVPVLINQEMIDEHGLSRSCGRHGESFTSRQHVDEAGFSNVGTSDEGVFGECSAGAFFNVCIADDEFGACYLHFITCFLLFLHAKVALISKISVRNAEFSLFLERTGCIPVI